MHTIECTSRYLVLMNTPRISRMSWRICVYHTYSVHTTACVSSAYLYARFRSRDSWILYYYIKINSIIWKYSDPMIPTKPPRQIPFDPFQTTFTELNGKSCYTPPASWPGSITFGRRFYFDNSRHRSGSGTYCQISLCAAITSHLRSTAQGTRTIGRGIQGSSLKDIYIRLGAFERTSSSIGATIHHWTWDM